MLLQRPVLSCTCPSDGQTRRGWRRGRIHILYMPSGLQSWHVISSFYFFFIREYIPNRWTYLNKSLHGDGNWLGIDYGGFEFLSFWGGIQYGAKTENDIKHRKLSCSGNIISLTNGENRAKIGQGTAEILWRVYTKFRFFFAIFPVSSTLKLYNFYTVQDRGIQSAYEMLRMKRAF